MKKFSFRMNNNRFKLIYEWILVFGFIFGSSFFFPNKLQAEIPAVCDAEKTPALKAVFRVSAIRKCLYKIAEPFKYKALYTYGHKDKIASLKIKDKEYSSEFTIGFQRRREERHLINQIKDNPSLDASVFKKARTFYSDYYDLTDLYNQWLSDPPTGNNKLQLAYTIASLTKIYPGFLLHLDYFKEHSRFPNTGGKSKARLDGEAVANEIFNTGLDSTGGLGVYLSANPYQTAQHAEADGGGIAIMAPFGKKNYINLKNEETVAALVKANIYIPNATGATRGAALAGYQFIYRANKGKNLWVSPLDFEEAVEGRFLIGIETSTNRGPEETHPPYIVDKAVLDFQDSTDITIELFSDENDDSVEQKCTPFKELVENNFYKAKFFDFLKGQANFDKHFFDIWLRCASYEGTFAPAKHRSCNELIGKHLKQQFSAVNPDGAFLNTYLKRDKVVQFKQVLEKCGCGAPDNITCAP